MVPGSQRLPTPHRAYFRLPSPSPADAGVHILYLLLFWLCIPLPSPWEEPVGWQLGRSLLSPLWVPASPLTSAWTPCARVRPLRGSVQAKAAPVPLSHCKRTSGLCLVTFALIGTAPQQGWRSEPDQAGETSALGRGKAMGVVAPRGK